MARWVSRAYVGSTNLSPSRGRQAAAPGAFFLSTRGRLQHKSGAGAVLPEVMFQPSRYPRRIPHKTMNYYNDFDKFSCAWLRELIADGLIPNGDVDERSITDIEPADLRGYTQCHFFCGIAGWSRALELAGWPSTRPVWTGSCPCQGYSVAGKGGGFSDERDLWPHFARLIRECRPDTVIGEQVDGAVGHGWLDRLCGDLEEEGYSVGAVVLGAHSVNAPHIRQRLYWVADTADKRAGRAGQAKQGSDGQNDGIPRQNGGEAVGGLADTEGAELTRDNAEERRALGQSPSGGGMGDTSVGEGDGRGTGNMAGAARAGRGGDDAAGAAGTDVGLEHADIAGREEQCGAVSMGAAQRSVERTGFWDNSILIPCRDGKARLVEPSIFPLVDGFPNRVGILRGAGNAIVPQVAAEFIKAYLEIS